MTDRSSSRSLRLGLVAIAALGMSFLAAGCGSSADTAPNHGNGSGGAAGDGSGGTGESASGGSGNHSGGGGTSGTGTGGAAAGGTGGTSGTGTGGGGNTVAGDPPIAPPGGATLTSCTTAQDAGAITFDSIPNWMDGNAAAYSIFHDDLCDSSTIGILLNAVPIANAHGLPLALAAIVASCDDAGLWGALQQYQTWGHEIANHSYTHVPAGPGVVAANAVHEVTDAKAAIDSHLTSPTTFYVYPYDYFPAEARAVVESSGHLGARGGSRDDNNGSTNPPINPAVAPASGDGSDFQADFDVWPRTYSKYARFYSPDFLKEHVFNAIQVGGWALREFHSVDDAATGAGFGPITTADYTAHLDWLVTGWNAQKVWTAGPTTVVKYRHARAGTTAAMAGNQLTYTTTFDPKYATPISVMVHTANDVPALLAMQGATPVRAVKVGPSAFSVTADPSLGPVDLSGCADAGPALDTTADIGAEPAEAASVCDIQWVHGTGSPGNMDNLEFSDPTQFQALPNTRQADGRDGSWSWYPQSISAKVEVDPADPANHAMHYVAGGLGTDVYSGVTLAFLGGNGAGACYDASMYTGVRFKIKGTASADDKGWGLASKITLSFVTAPTQPTSLGGDSATEIGHFHVMVDISAAATNWITVSVPFATGILPPWSGQGPTTLPTDKMQALDFGLQSGQTIDVWIDDIELY